MKAITKKELAQKMGISPSTLHYYLNKRWYDILKEYGYQKRQKILSVKQLNRISEIWGDW